MAEAQTSTSAERAGGRRLVSGIIWNGLGRGLPLLLALVITPFLVGALGVERWGLFTLALALIGILIRNSIILVHEIQELLHRAILGTGVAQSSRETIGKDRLIRTRDDKRYLRDKNLIFDGHANICTLCINRQCLNASVTAPDKFQTFKFRHCAMRPRQKQWDN